MSNFRAVVRAARLADEANRQSNRATRRDLIRRLAALKPEHLFEGMVRAFLNVEAAVESAEHYARDARWERLSNELKRRLAQKAQPDATQIAYEKNMERVSEIFDEMEELSPTGSPEERQPLSTKYKRKYARLAATLKAGQ
jgi:hypothetical protein